MGLRAKPVSQSAEPGLIEAARTSGDRFRLEWVLWCLGILGLIYCLLVGSQMLYARRAADKIVPVRSGESVTPTADTATDGAFASVGSEHSGASSSRKPEVVGRVEVPAIGLVTPLMSGDDSMSLSVGAGHIPGTAVPGGLGTVGIAGHRDTHFRQLGKVKPGMEVLLVGRAGVYHYRVVSFEIVTPEQVSVLATGDVPGLALVTCYPFQFIGHAPKRFIVHAELVSVAPDEIAEPSK